FLTTEQMICLPSHLRGQVERLASEIAEKPLTLEEFVSEIPTSRFLLFLHRPTPSSPKKIIGMLKIYLLNDSPASLERVLSKSTEIKKDNPIYISSVIVDQRYRGKGFGQKMFGILFEMLKKDALLEVRKNNNLALKLYRQLGFTVIGEDDQTYLLRKFI